ncbi:serine hydrolase [Mucilaginibacter sp. McL0603]|uniref:serine hydrolase n=1 Tax=Mucilaginibacter sp. McL0603 TaxID=3415670 RepID=UPI003CED6790
MKSLTLSVAFLFTLIFSPNSYSQSTDTIDKIKQVENNLIGPIQVEGDKPYTIVGQMAHYNIKGVSVAVIHNYKLEWAKGYGWADEALKIPVTTQTLFQAASISKSLNSVGVLKLVQDKKIDLYTDINTYLTTWKFPYDSLSKGKKISVANLLSHTGGLTAHGFGGYEKGKDTIPTIVQILNGQKPANSPAIRSMYEPGVKTEYSGGGIAISQLIVMDVTHQPYDKYMYDNVLKPLGMNSSTYAQPPVGVKPELLATAYYIDGKEVPGKYHIYPEQAAAGLWTNPTDLAKYIIETQLAYAGRSHKVLNQETTKLRLTPYIENGAALGVFIDNPDSTKYFEHSGANEGFRCTYYGSLENGNGVVVMVNSDGERIMPEIVNSVAKVYGFKGLYQSKLRKMVTVADSVLETYTGKYELQPKFFLTVTREGSQLYGQPDGDQKFEIFPESQNKFFLKGAPIEVEFIKDNKGEIIKCVVYQGGPHDAKKVK